MPYEYLPHTADIAFSATGKTLAEAFTEAARAVTHVMTDDGIASARTQPVHVEAESREALLFDFLDELITLLDTEAFFVADADLTVSSEDGRWFLEGTLRGDDAENYARHGDVKAPTYHGLSVEETADGWRLQATLDI